MYKNIPWKKLKHYVYVYVNPLDDKIFYVGKGFGDRALAHLSDDNDSEKVKKIKEIRKLGHEPKVEIIRFDMETSVAAEEVEAACIDVLGIHNLTNVVKGKKSSLRGRKSLDEIRSIIAPEEVNIDDEVLIILVKKSFYYGISDGELYEITRGVWHKNSMPKNYERAKLIFSVFDSVVQEIYEVAGWFPAFSTQYFTREFNEDVSGRIEFVGKTANDSIRSKYKGKSIREYSGRSYGAPIRGFNLNKS